MLRPSFHRAIVYFSKLGNSLIPIPEQGIAMPSELQARLFEEFTSKDALDAAREHSFAFVDEALGRRAYPSAAGIEGLAAFDDPLPEHGTDARDIVEQLSLDGARGVVSSL